ncbi:MAG TPA: diacylglycerol kinase [Steroidobacteraceae bacterium]|nr:diacylglycerol kinase [Steroidobacteraceae bacterium]
MSAWKNRPFAARLGCALRGFTHALAGERSLRLQCAALVAVLALLAWRRPPPVWWALALLAAAGVLAAELLNSALERLCDALHPQDSPAIRAVKDVGAAAVLVAALGALAVGAALVLQLLHTG